MSRRERAELASRYSGTINRAELDLVEFLATVPTDHRLSTAEVMRRRRTAESHRYVHAAEIAERMPELFAAFRADGRYSVDHLDTLWSRVNRHARALRVSDPARDVLLDVLDAAVATAIRDWVERTNITAITALSDVADEALVEVAPLVVAQTEKREAEEVRLTRRGTQFVLECGTEVVAESLWSSISDAALEWRREQREDAEDPAGPTMSESRGEVVLGILGGRMDQLSVTVNMYTRAGEGGYLTGVGWVSPTTVATLKGIAEMVRDLPGLAEVPATASYRFTTVQRALIEGRDGRCRFPGCCVRADRCDHDHLVNSPYTDPTSDGPTSVENGIALCRTHHQLKTLGIWRVSSPDDAVTLHWTGPGKTAATTTASGPLSPAHIGTPA
ncbi:MAG TPA: HNH endonuclease [Candidatus Corynebacterium avicola]|uniref:HNH endonuclease n=1 Tax=Candidatus Corynebacterium avicola TaxID=2838527 RepID=A0A9D1RPZ2_9CORY|nr:HNH endonuclease [Candidatus Corynebacterium avicola]